MNQKGLSIFDRLVQHSLHSDAGSDVDVGFNGINKVRSVYRACALNTAEISIQEALKDDEKINLDRNCAAMEHFGSGYTPYLEQVVREAEANARWFLKSLTSRERYLLKEDKCLVHALLSWPRGKEDEGGVDACKVMVAKLVLGVLGTEEDKTVGADDKSRVRNAIKRPPGETPETMFDSDQYTDDDLQRGEDVVEEEVKQLKEVGGVLLLDAQRIIMKYKSTNMTAWLKKRGFTCFFKCYDLEAFRFGTGKDIKKVRLILVCGPLCWAFCSADKTSARKLTARLLRSQAMRAKTAYFLQIIIGTIQNQMEFKQVLKIWGNVIVAFLMRIYLSQNLHVGEKPAVLVGKNVMSHRNLFGDDLLRMKASSNGFNRREQEKNRNKLIKEEENKDTHEKDRHIYTKLRNALSQRKDYTERIKSCAEIFREHQDTEDKQNKDRYLSKQEKQLERAAKKIGLEDKIIQDILKKLNQLYDEDMKKYEKEQHKKESQKRSTIFDMMKK